MFTTMILDSMDSQSQYKKPTDAGTIGTKLVPDIFRKNGFLIVLIEPYSFYSEKH